jgi:hypothetical protein
MPHQHIILLWYESNGRKALRHEEELHEGITPLIRPDVTQPHTSKTILDRAGFSSSLGYRLHHVWRNVRHLVPIESNILPKSGTRPIAEHITGGGVEDCSAQARQLDVEPRPRFSRIHSLEPGPSMTKGKIQEFKIGEA